MKLDNHSYYFEEIYKIKDSIWNEKSLTDDNRARLLLSFEDYKILKELRDEVKEITGVYYNMCSVSLFEKEAHWCSFHYDDGRPNCDNFAHNIAVVNLGDSRTFQYKDKNDNVIKSEDFFSGRVFKIDEETTLGS